MEPFNSKCKSSTRPAPRAAGSAAGKPGRWIAASVLTLVLGGGLFAYVKFGAGFRGGSGESPVEPPLVLGTDLPQIISVGSSQGDGVSNQTRSAAPLPTDPVELLKLGNDFLNQGQPAKAIPYYHRAIELNSEDEEIHFNLGFAYTRIGYTNQAIHHYLESLRIYPDYAEAHNNLGNLYVSLGQYGKAIEHFTSALNTMPDHASALNNLGRCLAAQNKIEESVAQFSQALRINPDYFEAHYNLGRAFMALKKYDEAMAEFGEALRLRPDYQRAAFDLAHARDLKAKAGL